MEHIGTLHILHTNDVHSRFERMPQIATCLKQLRAHWNEQGEHVITVDVGDHVDRSRISTEATWGHSNVRVLNASGYQYVTIGNNEGLTFPKQQLNELYQDANFTIVLSNIADQQSGRLPDWAVPYAIHEWSGFRVAILAVTVTFDRYYRQLGWNTLESLPLLRQQVSELRPKADAVILLSHLGYWADKMIAEKVEGIDLILGGHTHHLLPEGERVGQTLIAQAGKFGDYVGHVQLVIDKERHCVVEKKAEVILVEDFPADPDLQQLIDAELKSAIQVMSEPVTTLAYHLALDWSRETPFASFLASSVRYWTGAEIGLVNSGLLLKPLAAGGVSRKDLFECLPHPIKPCLLSLSGKQLVNVLQQSLQEEVMQKKLFGFGFRGKITGWMGVDGMQIIYSTAGDRRVIEAITVNGQALQEDRMYRVGTIDMFLFNQLFKDFQQVENVRFYMPEVLREVVAETINKEELLRPSFENRWIYKERNSH